MEKNVSHHNNKRTDSDDGNTHNHDGKKDTTAIFAVR
jgi:hypothetical protein